MYIFCLFKKLSPQYQSNSKVLVLYSKSIQFYICPLHMNQYLHAVQGMATIIHDYSVIG